MPITDPHVIPEDLQILPIAALDTAVLATVEHQPGDFAIMRPRSRTPPKIVDAQTGELLRRFMRPRTIVDVLLEFSAEHRVDPEQILADAYPVLQRFVDVGLLVEEGSERYAAITAMFDVDDRVAGWTVVRCLQVLDDVELYQVRSADGTTAALKIGRRDERGIRDMSKHEAGILAYIGGGIAPRLIEEGAHEGRQFVAMEWRRGVNAHVVAGELQSVSDSARLLRLCVSIADAYADLHERGVLHGDVHERNLLVDADGAVTILDFGLGRRGSESARRVKRGGVGRYFEPEYAAAHVDGRSSPAVTPSGEQYSVAALLYTLFTGTSYLDFAADRDRAMRQISEEPALSFSARGRVSMPELEGVLRRALDKRPAQRFESMRAFADALRRVEHTHSSTGADEKSNIDLNAVARDRTDTTFGALRPGGPYFQLGAHDPPRANVTFGAAGVAHAFSRLAATREDASLLSLADIWGSWALAMARSRSAFFNERMKLTPASLGRASLYHTLPGVHAVRALTARAMGDLSTMRTAVASYVEACRRPGDKIDLTLGQAGLLLGCSLLLDAVPEFCLEEFAELRACGDRLVQRLWKKLDREPSIGSPATFRSLGIAHGWAGIVYATLRWHQSTGTPQQPAIAQRLAELAARAEPDGRGLRWAWIDNGEGPSTHGYMSGWCNGSAGFVHLWLTANAVLGDGGFVSLAEGAAWNTWEDPQHDDVIDLCCGLAGRSYALLAMYRHTGDREWLTRARTLAARAHVASDDPMWAGSGTSLYKSQLGSALLAAEIERPESARMPLFESEGWPRPSTHR